MFDFSKVVDRHGTWCTQWDYVADRFGSADLLPFTISDMDFATAPCILEALTQRLSHGVLGYSRWKNDEFLAAISHWFLSRHNTQIRSSVAGIWPLGHLYGVGVDPPVVIRGRCGGYPYSGVRCVLQSD